MNEAQEEKHEEVEHKKEQKIEAKFQNDLIPTPSGKKFRAAFKKIVPQLDIDVLPYMHSFSMDKDIVLYRAMQTILSIRLGELLDGKHQAAVHAITKFMHSDAMKSLLRNEYASNEHENQSREACFKFIHTAMFK